MDISTTIAHIQLLIFIWTLLGFLFAWMIIFAWLALRPQGQKQVEREDFFLSSPSIPITTAPAMQQAIATVATRPVQSQTESAQHEPVGDVGVAPVV